MPKICRVMKSDGGKPVLGESASALGARVPTDICPDSDGKVYPATGGMSVSPSMYRMPARMVPMRLRHLVPNAAGSNSLSVWSMGEGPFIAEGIASGLRLRPDPKNSDGHGFVEPEAVMSLNQYQAALTTTQDQWTLDEQ